jgi:hypothetical protein
MEQRNDYNNSGKIIIIIIIIIIIAAGVRLSPLVTAATIGLLYQPQMTDDGDCGKIGGMKNGRGNRSTRRKPAPYNNVHSTRSCWSLLSLNAYNDLL